MLDFDQVKALVDLQAYCKAHLDVKGRNKYVCPKCGSGSGPNKTAAFTVYAQENRWCCYSCNNGGDVFDLAGILGNTENRLEQLQLVAKWAGIADSEPHRENKPSDRRANAKPSTDYSQGRKKEASHIERARGHIGDPEAVGYLTSRGISLEEAKSIGMGYDPDKKRLVIPWKGSAYYHIDRDITDKEGAKYIKPKVEKVGAQPLYNPAALNEAAYFVVEGALDAIAVGLCGFEAVALGGTGARSAVDAIAARRPKGVAVVMLDGDDSGRDAATKLCGLLDEAQLPSFRAETETKDAAEWLRTSRDSLKSFLRRVYDEALESAQEGCKKAYSNAMKRLRAFNPSEVVASLYELEGAAKPIPTGFPSLDSVLGGGLLPSLYVLGAVSSLGKTTFAVQIADQVAAQRVPVLFVTIEQSAREIVAKSLSRLMSDGKRMFSTMDITSAQRRSEWGKGEHERLFDACSLYTEEVSPFLRILEGTAQPSVADVAAAADEMRGNHGVPPVVFVDYLQLLASQNERDSDKKAVDRNIMALRQLSRDLQTPVFAISSLNRSSYSEGVTMDAFKESGAIEYGSDVLLGLQPAGMRESIEKARDSRLKSEADSAVRKSKSEAVRKCELVVLKNRAGRTPYDGLQFEFNAVASTFSEPNDAQASQDEVFRI